MVLQSRHRILIHFSGNHRNTYESGCHTRQPLLFLVGIIWITTHIIIMIIVAKIIKAPFFYVAVGSQANGGAASAPIVAAAFSPFSSRRSTTGCFGLCRENLRSLCLWFITTPNISNYHLNNSSFKW
jgi:hypothetical protein